MEFVEMLRVRRVLVWYACILPLLMVVVLVATLAQPHTIVVDSSGWILVSDVFIGCAFAAWIVTTCLVAGLSAEESTTAVVWTRPQPREAIAWRYVAVDVAAILIAYALAVVLVLAFIAALGQARLLRADAHMGSDLALAVASALMWYGLVQLAVSRMPARAGLVAGISWPVFLTLGSLATVPLPPVLHGVLAVLNLANPVAWIGNIEFGTTTHHVQIIALPDAVRAVCALAIALVTTAAAVRLWATREV